MKPLKFILVLVAIGYAQFALAEQLKLLGVYSQLAVFSKNGEEFAVHKGKESNDVFLQNIDRKKSSVVITQNGKLRSLNLGEKSLSREIIEADENRLFYTYGKINGVSAIFLVDTGASHVTMNQEQAERLKIDYKKLGYPVQSITASGVHPAYALKLKSVSVGNLKVKNVSALVLDGSMPKTILLGMSFLEKIKMSNNGNLLTLSK